MKKFLLTVLSVLVLSSLTAQTASQVTVAFIKTKARHYDTVILQGKITAQVDDDEFILADDTGSIKIDLEDQAEYELRGAGQNIQGAVVRVYGSVDKDDWDDPAKVKVMKIRVVSGGTPGGVPDNF